MADITAMLQAAAGQVGGDYQISRSLRFNSADSAYLSRTPASAGNRQKFTISAWVKRSKLGAPNGIFGSGTNGNNEDRFAFAGGGSANKLTFDSYTGGATNLILLTTQVFRDASAWYHVVLAVDTTQATASNRVLMYVNGIQITAFDTATYPALNANLNTNNNSAQYVGNNPDSQYFDGYMTEVNLIDGQQLTPSSFGEVNATTGVWSPIEYTGSYGTNGFYLNFSDNSGVTSTTLGKDQAGSNNWTPNNFSVTAGVGNDSLVDSPTQYGTDTGAGGEVRGNYATLNPLRQATGAGASLANGNLQFTCISGPTGSQTTFATMGVTTGKWYFEMNVTTTAGGGPTYYPGIGVNTDLALAVTSQSGSDASGYMYLRNGEKFNNGSLTAYGNAYVNNDVVGVALDMDAGKIWFSINGTFQNSGSPTGGTNEAFSGITGTAVPCVIGLSSAAGHFNFGQRPFAYTAPSGFKALVTTNLPEPTVVQGDDYFNTVLYTGTGAAQSITGVGFQPDLVWMKSRSASRSNALADAVRDRSKILYSDLALAELTSTATQDLTSFDVDGFSVGTVSNAGSTNTSGDTIVAWNWNAGGSNATNTDGTITSTVRANPTAGFSIVSYTGDDAVSATIGHGLGATPSMIIVKNRQEAISNPAWPVYHSSLGATKYLDLQTTAAEATATSVWNDTAPTSSLVTIGTADSVNSGSTHIMYCFAAIPGYSAFGSYTGNGSADGPFVYTGFRPAFIMAKRTNSTADWAIFDATRNTFNAFDKALVPNTSGAEVTATFGDILSNGFKWRYTGVQNASGGTYIFAAFATSPFKYSLAR